MKDSELNSEPQEHPQQLKKRHILVNDLATNKTLIRQAKSVATVATRPDLEELKKRVFKSAE